MNAPKETPKYLSQKKRRKQKNKKQNSQNYWVLPVAQKPHSCPFTLFTINHATEHNHCEVEQHPILSVSAYHSLFRCYFLGKIEEEGVGFLDLVIILVFLILLSFKAWLISSHLLRVSLRIWDLLVHRLSTALRKGGY